MNVILIGNKITDSLFNEQEILKDYKEMSNYFILTLAQQNSNFWSVLVDECKDDEGF